MGQAVYRRFELKQGLGATRDAAARRPSVDEQLDIRERGQALSEQDMKGTDAIAVQAQAYPHVEHLAFSWPTSEHETLLSAWLKCCPISVRLSFSCAVSTPCTFN